MARLCSDAVVVAPVRLCYFLVFLLFIFSFLSSTALALTTYDRNTLLDIGSQQTHAITDLISVFLLSGLSSWPAEILRRASSNNNNNNSDGPSRSGRRRKKHRGRRGGVKNRLRAQAHRPPLPSILLANVQSLQNKLDDLRARVQFQRDIRDCNIF